MVMLQSGEGQVIPNTVCFTGRLSNGNNLIGINGIGGGMRSTECISVIYYVRPTQPSILPGLVNEYQL